MKFLLINIRYKHVGGPERYLFNLKALLESKGHNVVPFSIKYDDNEPSEYEAYFAPPLSKDGSIYFKEQKWDLGSFYTTLERNFYSREVEEKLSLLIDKTKPDFAVVLLYLRKLSPSILVALSKKKVPFAVRLSDFGMICAGATLFRRGLVCEKCVKGTGLNSILHRCVHGSLGASMINWLAMTYNTSKGHFSLIRKFLAPSEFLINKMIEAGWSRDQFIHLPTFAHVDARAALPRESDRILYAGRLDYGKGIHVLLEAILRIRDQYGVVLNLRIAGDGDDEYIEVLRKFVQTNRLDKVTFVGRQSKDKLYNEYGSAIVSVIPSLYYDNMPNSALESLSCGTPVVAPNHGCFPEFVENGKTGFLYRPGDADDLATAIMKIVNGDRLSPTMNENAMQLIKQKHSPEVHYAKLMGVVKSMIAKDFSTKEI